MAGPIVTPKDILPARGVAVIVSVSLAMLSILFLLPIFGTLYYDGLGSVPEWPPLFFWFLGFGAAFLSFAGWVLLKHRQVGAKVSFHTGGFTLEVRHLFRRLRRHKIEWKGIEEVKLVEVPRGGDLLAFRLTHEAAVRQGLIEKTTRETASKMLVRREVTLPLNLVQAGVDDAVAQFKASAEQSGGKLVETSGFNVIVAARYVWAVKWP